MTMQINNSDRSAPSRFKLPEGDTERHVYLFIYFLLNSKAGLRRNCGAFGYEQIEHSGSFPRERARKKAASSCLPFGRPADSCFFELCGARSYRSARSSRRDGGNYAIGPAWVKQGSTTKVCNSNAGICIHHFVAICN